MKEIKLTQYSHGAGCGCKISPKILDDILNPAGFKNPPDFDKNLLVGNDKKDDAAVYDLGNGQAIISTTDFFMPIVDDPFDFGRIASVNAISDVYAMGGTPLMAISILGWPIEQLSSQIAQKVIEGSRHACKEAGIALAGGHSIDSPEPIFGLAVTGLVDKKSIKQNSTATIGCKLYLTKPLGIGILTTAQKKGLLKKKHKNIATDLMVKLNNAGISFGKCESVKAMTDVTGFGLLGHLCEVCEGSNLNAVVYYDAVPQINGIDQYIDQKCIPGGTVRNWDSYGSKISGITERQKTILCDPQTSGGLLIAVEPEGESEFLDIAHKQGLKLAVIGLLKERDVREPIIFVE
ncbi:MAG: selenide, water dikinase SelD [Cytophagales bacterium]|nr:selenide, water dikinase SelD [Cytophagales bacterium]